MATISVQTPAAAGTALSLTAAAGGGDQYANSGKEIFVVDNADASPITVTFVQQTACSDGFNSPTHDVVQTVTNAVREMFPPLDPAIYNDANGNVQVTYSAVTSVTVGAVKAT